MLHDHGAGREAREQRDHPIRLHVRLGPCPQPGGEPTRQRGPHRPIDRGGVDPDRAHKPPQRVGRMVQRGLHVRIAAVDARDPPVEGIGIDIAREQQRKTEQQPVRRHHQGSDRRDTDPTVEGRAQQQQETADRQDRGRDADRQDRVARDAGQADANGEVRQRAVGLPVQGEQRLVRGPRRGSHHSHREEPGGGQRERTSAVGGHRSGPHDAVHG